MNMARTSSVRAAGRSRITRKTVSTDTVEPAIGGLEIPPLEQMPRTAAPIQNTHWYRAGWSSFSANPHTAAESEIRRVGLHSCTGRNCPSPYSHSWNAEEYYRVQILKQWAEEGFY